MKMPLMWAVYVCLIVCLKFIEIKSQCPWSRELIDLHTDCVCAYSDGEKLTVQCSPVNFTKLMSAIAALNVPLNVLYINNSTINKLVNNTFTGLEIGNLQLSKSKITQIENNAFEGLQKSLKSLNLQDNLLTEVPTDALKGMTVLESVDLSHNLITSVPNNTFKGLPLTTLKLSDNNLTIANGAFNGLESTLKSLNLQAVELNEIPQALKKLKVLVFLDLAQNKIGKVESGFLSSSKTLSALNLERNRILKLDGKAFTGVNGTLSSLSLLNNLLLEFPAEALHSLPELRVLDLGFNGIRYIPNGAFKNNKFLTLLALDGNPLSTVPLSEFEHLNSTLRGISIGGSYLVCDCRIKWITEWIRDYNLQVTSRERNPQFCGKPDHLRRKNFVQLSATDLICVNDTTSTSATAKPNSPLVNKPRHLPLPDSGVEPQNKIATDVPSSQDVDIQLHIAPISENNIAGHINKTENAVIPKYNVVSSSNEGIISVIRIKNTYRKDSSLVVEWNTGEDKVLGFQLVYRKFGEQDFKKTPTIGKNQRKYELRNMPLDECLIVCVVTSEQVVDLKMSDLSHKQCAEIKADELKTVSLDKVVIGASAAICAVIVMAVLTVILLHFKKKDKSKIPISPSLPVREMPVVKTDPDWENLSSYSAHSTPKIQKILSSTKTTSSNNTYLSENHLRSSIPKITNGYSKTCSTNDDDIHMPYPSISNKFLTGNIFDFSPIHQPEKSFTKTAIHGPYLGNYIPKKKRHRSNGRLASASSSTECDSDWNGKSNWKDHETDVIVNANHLNPGHRKHNKSYKPR